MATGLSGDDPTVRRKVLSDLVAKKVATQRGQMRDAADRPGASAPKGRKARSIAAVQPSKGAS